MPYGVMPDPNLPEDQLLAMYGVEPPPAESFQPQRFQGGSWLEALAGLEGIQHPQPRGFGEGLAYGLAGSLGGQGSRVAATRQRFEAGQAERQKLFDLERMRASQDYRKQRGETMGKLASEQRIQGQKDVAFQRDNPPVTQAELDATPSLVRAGYKVGDPFSRELRLKLAMPEKPITEHPIAIEGPSGPVYVTPGQALGKAPAKTGSAAGSEVDPKDYIDASRGYPLMDVSKAFNPKVKQALSDYAHKNKIPVAGDREMNAIQMVDDARSNIESIKSTVSGFLPGGVLSRMVKGPLNIAAAWTQANPDISSFNAYRTAAIQIIQTLGSLGKGLRINQAEIQAALKYDIPQITDTMPTAAQKLGNLSKMLDHIESAVSGTKVDRSLPPVAAPTAPQANASDRSYVRSLGIR